MATITFFSYVINTIYSMRLCVCVCVCVSVLSVCLSVRVCEVGTV